MPKSKPYLLIILASFVFGFVLISCQTPVEPLERNSPRAPFGNNFVPITPNGFVSFPTDSPHVYINLTANTEYFDGFLV